MKKIALDIKNLHYSRFDQTIIDNLSLTIYDGEFVVLVGPNGSGKSSLIKIINGQYQANGGEALVDNQNILGLPVHTIAHTIATLTQDIRHSSFSDLSVMMNMELALRRSSPKSLEAIQEYLSTFNPTLTSRLNILAGHLSGGQRQSLALAICFAHTPKILLLDEHTSALDPKAANALMALTNTHVREKKLTTIMITHSLDHAMAYGDRLIALSEGRIVCDLTGADKANLSREKLISLAY